MATEQVAFYVSVAAVLRAADERIVHARLALVVDDPDAPDGTVVHWVLFNLPIERRHLDAGIPTDTEPVQKPMLRVKPD